VREKVRQWKWLFAWGNTTGIRPCKPVFSVEKQEETHQNTRFGNASGRRQNVILEELKEGLYGDMLAQKGTD
jgi:hypothetical protein